MTDWQEDAFMEHAFFWFFGFLAGVSSTILLFWLLDRLGTL